MYAELSNAVDIANTEPMTFMLNFLDGAGLSPQSSLGRRLCYDMYALYLLRCVDMLDCSQPNTAEHLSRVILQGQKAARKNPKSPDFTGLVHYTRHCDAATGEVRAPESDKWIAEQNKADGFYLKQMRLSKEEEEANTRAAAKAKGKQKPPAAGGGEN
mgnify:CR=1 FL=1